MISHVYVSQVFIRPPDDSQDVLHFTSVVLTVKNQPSLSPPLGGPSKNM